MLRSDYVAKIYPRNAIREEGKNYSDDRKERINYKGDKNIFLQKFS